jgi:hypothetical protein
MRGLDGPDILRLWEIGEQLSSVERTMALLHLGLPEARMDDLYALDIGQRDALLIELRERTFGPTLRCCTDCPRCSSRLELAVDSSALRIGTAPKLPLASDATALYWLQLGELTLAFRLPNSRDLVAISAEVSPQNAERRLLGRCLQAAARRTPTADAADSQTEIDLHSEDVLSDAVVEQLGAELLRLDPQAVLRLALRCAACGCAWKSIFDIGNFLFSEVTAQAQRLAHEVCVLARALGWSERDILAMNQRRRQLYLQEIES